ncbi:MAG: 4-hydroxy-tetrahydrodipicolinate reductase [Betaproteobacteria bacterium]|nr:MAG: 4-hydroxy-tetrahydrodipicolinate reductase [Betaproteobacteria bacterium]TDI80545.1 MAG: 4-hydroxy-tetrahydrodipicolinate reductase [Betaproteobacteria bacterium]
MTTLNIAVAGSSGRMGRVLLKAVTQALDLRLSAALEQTGNSYLMKDVGELIGAPCSIAITDNFSAALPGCDVLIDFTCPAGTFEYLSICRTKGVKMVIGTTGFSVEQKKALKAASRDVALVLAPNMSVGVNVIFKLLDMAARVLSEGYDIEIIEAHHRHKVDAPSGTALHMGGVVAQALGRNLSEVAVYRREGVIGERVPSTIGFASVRGGDIVGDHTVMFAGTGERIEISHKASSRATFAVGALRAARFLVGKQNGLFDMQDVLGLR